MRVMAALQGCMGNPMAAMQYMNDPEVGPVLGKLMGKMMGNPAMAGMMGGRGVCVCVCVCVGGEGRVAGRGGCEGQGV